MGTQINTSVSAQQTGDVSKKQDGYKARISLCYNELGQYSAPSMDNICSIFNNGFKADGNNFYSAHSGYCDIYGAAASAFGNALHQQSNDLEASTQNVEAATRRAVAGLQGLIVQEKSFMTRNNITPNEDVSNKETEENKTPDKKEENSLWDSIVSFFTGNKADSAA